MAQNKYFLISGPARTGKSLIRKRLLDKYGINGFCTDSLVSMLVFASPELGVSFQDSDYHHITKYIQGLLSYQSNVANVFEGVGVYAADWPKFKDFANVEMIGVGSREISVLEKMHQIRTFRTQNDWTRDLNDTELHSLVENLIAQSQQIKSACDDFELPFFDLSQDFQETVEEVVDYIYSRI